MNRRILLSCIIMYTMTSSGFAQSVPIKREFRGAWIASVANLDWPSTPSTNAEAQQAALIDLLDTLKVSGINAVVFQIRPECDALYESSYEPWSYWLTGVQGLAPSPFYDPLSFAIGQAHERGMELHAWFNPYRAERQVGSYAIDSTHVSRRHPDWVLTFGTLKMLDPGLPMVREFVTNVILDVVHRYDIDGVHFDDYFYPYPPDHIRNQDSQTFADYPRGFTDRDDWRRDNVNLFVKMVFDSIQVVKPYVKFGISPFGIWKNGVPPGISGLDAVNVIYADPLAWIQERIVEYISPQLYWPFGGGQDYGRLLPWWASQAGETHLYVGQAAYRIGNWRDSEMPNQLRLNRETENVSGSIFFRATNFMTNPKGFVDTLKADFYRFPAINPVMSWKDTEPPNPPSNLRYERLGAMGRAGLRWDAPAEAADGDIPGRFVIYRFTTPNIQLEDLDDPSHILTLQGGLTGTPAVPADLTESYYFTVTSLDRNANESGLGDVLYVPPPTVPVIASPADGRMDVPPEIVFTWQYPEHASFYELQVSTDSIFQEIIDVNGTMISDTFKIVQELAGQERYFWRVGASNAGGKSGYSDPFDFMTGFPAIPLLVYPPNNTGYLPVDLVFTWKSTAGAETYHLQIAKSANFVPSSVIVDSTGLADTTFTMAGLEDNRFHFWRVTAANDIGSSDWSEIFKFKTVDLTDVLAGFALPSTFRLDHNYPNPFNAMTTIPFDVAEYSRVIIRVYDSIGREVMTLIDRHLEPGRHEAVFDGSGLTSGVYFIRMVTDGGVFTGKMLLLK